MNNIELSTIYLPILDEVYKEASLTSILQGDEATLQRGSNGEVKVLKLDMDGLGDFSRSSGYTSGSASAVWETLRYDRERSQKLTIDRLDNDDDRKILYLYLDKLPLSQIAQILGTSTAAVKQKLYRIRIQLKKLKDQEE